MGASILEFRRVLHPPTAALGQHNIAALGVAPEPSLVIAVGTAVAFISGMFAIRFFMRYVDQHRLTPFAVYCWVFGAANILIIAARRHAGLP